ncbi:hypothetical protein WAB17_13270 [Parerythrobacter aurantius]|uniref:hypothetical protein n=1 Tax=Parerythrobacter aurantius TaxID=3127706 RepID=UPI00325649D4
MSPDELDELFGLKPKFDMPPGARRSMERVGILGQSEGGLPARSLGNQPEGLVRASLAGLRQPMVSRWGHILLRRALSSRLKAPAGMAPAEFAGLRAQALNAIGEFEAARAVAQDVDVGNWSVGLTNAAVDAAIATGDITAACPAVRFRTALRKDAEWQMLGAICKAFAGESASARSELIRMRSQGKAPAIDVLLAQRYAGAAGRGRSAVNLEWDKVEELNPWRYGLAVALGAEIPESLTDNPQPYYQRVAARNPALPVAQRLAAADLAASEGILSSNALIDLYSQYWAANGSEGNFGGMAGQLRTAYLAADPAARLAAMKSLWDGDSPRYSRLVLTSHAAGRMPVTEALVNDSDALVASMLSAGLDRDALEWGPIVPEGSSAWAQLVLVQPSRSNPVASSAIENFMDDDPSQGQRRSAFLVAGLAGLDRLEAGAAAELSETLGMDLDRQTRWTRLISRAAQLRNQPLTVYLAGIGMQGDGWDKMTPLHLYTIVRALNAAGLGAEARLIAAEAVARG